MPERDDWGWWLKVSLPASEAKTYGLELVRLCRATPFKLLGGGEGLRVQELSGQASFRITHTDRTPVVAVAQWTMNFWPSANISLTWGNPDTDQTSVYLETVI